MPVALIRYLMILSEVPASPEQIDAGTLARRLRERGVSVTLRTVQRDLERLARYFPLRRARRGKPYRWYWAKALPAFAGPMLGTVPSLKPIPMTGCVLPRGSQTSCDAAAKKTERLQPSEAPSDDLP